MSLNERFTVLVSGYKANPKRLIEDLIHFIFLFTMNQITSVDFFSHIVVGIFFMVVSLGLGKLVIKPENCVKFEDEGEGPRVFQNLSGAIKYFTRKTLECERVRGQYVTWAEETTRNWVLYVFMGPDTSNASYSNPDNWWPFGEIRPDPYQAINENIIADKEYKEKLNAHYQIDEKLKIEQDN